MSGAGEAAVTATAHANIALIKYWGKANDELIIPRTSSLSLTLDELYTTTTVRFLSGDETGLGASIGGKAAVVATNRQDRATLDGKPVTGRPMERISALLDIVRELADISAPAEVTSLNTVPTAAGLASSASGFAALAGAAAAAAGLDLSKKELSRLARRGSGSASRSIFGGLAIWHAGHDDESSYAEPLEAGVNGGAFASKLALIVLVLNAGPKAISSREAMRLTIETSPEYEPWIRQHADHLAEAWPPSPSVISPDSARPQKPTLWGCTPPCAPPRRRSTTCPKQATRRCGPSGTPARRDSRRGPRWTRARTSRCSPAPSTRKLSTSGSVKDLMVQFRASAPSSPMRDRD